MWDIGQRVKSVKTGSIYTVVSRDEVFEKYRLKTDHPQEHMADWHDTIQVKFSEAGQWEVIEEG